MLLELFAPFAKKSHFSKLMDNEQLVAMQTTIKERSVRGMERRTAGNVFLMDVISGPCLTTYCYKAPHWTPCFVPPNTPLKCQFSAIPGVVKHWVKWECSGRATVF